jgi:RNA polymerase sigma factor (sigma-70 family)
MKTDMTSSATIHRSENVIRYFKDIKNPKYDPIEDRLVRELFADREMFKDIIINAHIRLVASIAKTYDNNDKFMDFNQEGIEGLYEAFDKYDPTSPAKFSSYAALWIKAKMSMLCRTFNMVQRSNQGKIGSKAIKFQEEFYKKNMREATTDEIIDYLSENCNIDVIYTDEIFNITVESIDHEINDDGDGLTPETSGEFAVKTASENEYLVESEKEELSDAIQKMLSILDKKEREYVTRHIIHGESYADIAEDFGCSTERVRQIVVGGLKKMKSSDFAKNHFACYLK